MSTDAIEEPNAIVWINPDCLSSENPALRRFPDVPAIFVFDEPEIERTGMTLKRIVFQYECLLEMPVEIRKGDPVEHLLGFARSHKAKRVITTESPDPRVAEIAEALGRTLRFDVLPLDPFLEIEPNITFDLKRFSRYWRTAERYAFG